MPLTFSVRVMKLCYQSIEQVTYKYCQSECHGYYSFFQRWDAAAKAQMKKVTKLWAAEQRKAEKTQQREVNKILY